ncbi:90 kDa surface protein [Trypanosoma cruzi]|nr:90 kDa surface protein [Trypanosoma cruzi]
MKCEGMLCGLVEQDDLFYLISFLGEGIMYTDTYGCLVLLGIRNKSAARLMVLKVLGVLLDSYHFFSFFVSSLTFKFWFAGRCGSSAVVMIPSVFFGVRFFWLLPFITMRWLCVV